MSGKISKTLIVVILDESGSMEVQKNDVMGGYNSFLQEQLEVVEDQARLVLVKFNTEITVAHSATALASTPRLEGTTYRPSGGTALLDAVAEGIRIGQAAVQKEERVLVLIMTDGEENSSKKATTAEVKKLIEDQEKTGEWTFAYIGANPDGWSKAMGQDSRVNANAVEYCMDSPRQNFGRASKAVHLYRRKEQRQQTEGFYSEEAE